MMQQFLAIQVENPSLVDNVLVTQKDQLLYGINHAEDADQVRKMVVTLKLLAPLWEVLGYGYKTRELVQRIRDKVAALLRNEEEYRDTCRRNSSHRNRADHEIKQLELVDCEAQQVVTELVR